MELLRPKFSIAFLICVSALNLFSCGSTPVTDIHANSDSIAPATDVKATSTTTSILVTWKNPQYDGDYFIRVQHSLASDDNYILDATLSDKDSYTISELETSKEYKIRLQSISKDGNDSSYTDPITIKTVLPLVLPSAVNVDFSYATFDSRTVTWSWSNSDLSGIDSFDISIKKDSDTTFTTLQSNSKDIKASESYIDNTTGGSSMSYRITVHYTDDAKTTANFDSPVHSYALPGAINLSASYNSYNSATVKWGWSSSDYSPIKSFDVYRQIYNDGNWAIVSACSNTNIVASETCVDSAVSGTTVKYRVAVHYDNGVTSNFDMGTSINFSLPSANTLAAVYTDYDNVTFSWKWSSSDLTSIKSYDISRQVMNNGTWTPILSGMTTIGTSYTDATPNSVTVKYRLTVRYKDSKNTVTNFDMGSSVSYALPAITGLSAAVAGGSVNLNWTWTNTTHYDVLANYVVQRSPASTTPSWSSIYTNSTSLNPPAHTYTDATVGSTSYQYMYRIQVNYKSGGAQFTSTNAILPLPTPSSVTTDLIFMTPNYFIYLYWNYPTFVNNIENFSITSEQLDSSNNVISGTSSNRTVPYVSSQSASYLQTFPTFVFCTALNATQMRFHVSGLSSNTTLNTNSAEVVVTQYCD